MNLTIMPVAERKVRYIGWAHKAVNGNGWTMKVEVGNKREAWEFDGVEIVPDSVATVIDQHFWKFEIA